RTAGSIGSTCGDRARTGRSNKSRDEISRRGFRADIDRVGSVPSFLAAKSWESWLIRKLVVLAVVVAMPLGCTSMLSPSPAYSARTTSPNLLTGDSASFDVGIGSW